MKLIPLKSIKFFSADERSQRQLKNIYISFIYKSVAIGCTFLTVPLTLHYLDVSTYGIWLTITSIVGWIGFFDGGLGNGLKNKLSEAVSNQQMSKARSYVTSAYIGIIGIVICIVVIFMIVSSFINWTAVLKSPVLLTGEIKTTVYIVFILFGIRLIVDLMSVILSAHQLVGIVALINMIINLFILAGTFIITKIVHSNKLVYLGSFISVVPVIILIMTSIFFFKKEYKHLAPTIKSFDLGILKEIVSLGMTFFVIQIAALIIFSSDNLIITQLFGPGEVASYNICYKYFGILTLGWSMIITPYWVAFNEAFVKKDFKWLRKTIRFLLKAWLLLLIGVIIFIAFSTKAYSIWVGKGIIIPLQLSLHMGLFIVLSTNLNICAYFLNGIGKIKLQFYASIFSGLSNIPLTIYFAKNLHMGISGVILGTSLSIILGGILMWIQTYKVIRQEDDGIWSK